jgi:hypothetical protein
MMVLSEPITLRFTSSMAWPSEEQASSGYSCLTSGPEPLRRLSLRTSMARAKYCTGHLSFQHSGSANGSVIGMTVRSSTTTLGRPWRPRCPLIAVLGEPGPRIDEKSARGDGVILIHKEDSEHNPVCLLGVTSGAPKLTEATPLDSRSFVVTRKAPSCLISRSGFPALCRS